MNENPFVNPYRSDNRGDRMGFFFLNNSHMNDHMKFTTILFPDWHFKAEIFHNFESDGFTEPGSIYFKHVDNIRDTVPDHTPINVNFEQLEAIYFEAKKLLGR